MHQVANIWDTVKVITLKGISLHCKEIGWQVAVLFHIAPLVAETSFTATDNDHVIDPEKNSPAKTSFFTCFHKTT